MTLFSIIMLVFISFVIVGSIYNIMKLIKNYGRSPYSEESILFTILILGVVVVFSIYFLFNKFNILFGL